MSTGVADLLQKIKKRVVARWYKIVGHPKDQVKPFGPDISTVMGVVQRIVLVNLIAFCVVMGFLIFVKATEPVPGTKAQPQDSNVFERAQKYD